VDAGGQPWLCPTYLDARRPGDAEKVEPASVVGATPMWEWAGNGTTVFSY
jgi:hypothetical protein